MGVQSRHIEAAIDDVVVAFLYAPNGSPQPDLQKTRAFSVSASWLKGRTVLLWRR
jgi:exonuclease III